MCVCVSWGRERCWWLRAWWLHVHGGYVHGGYVQEMVVTRVCSVRWWLHRVSSVCNVQEMVVTCGGYVRWLHVSSLTLATQTSTGPKRTPCIPNT